MSEDNQLGIWCFLMMVVVLALIVFHVPGAERQLDDPARPPQTYEQRMQEMG